ncbi:MAG: TonB-dependent hemoglobin/transferrin/lactoferrin family receptor [Candidatus Methylacidiphilales bacterium]|nr:TonB-dependent hemoglobin/transferrin/lactoferrin family receptor [Candidatus Methylacidiphilales bacterium]
MKLRCALAAGLSCLILTGATLRAQPAGSTKKETQKVAPATKKKDTAPAATTKKEEGTAKPEVSSSIPEVVVSATRTRLDANSVAGSVSVYDAEDLQRNQVSNIRDLTRDELDVSSLKNAGGLGPAGFSGVGLQGYNIRGIDGNRILIQTDDIRQPEQYTFGGVYAIGRNYQDLNSLKRIEILKGSASSLYGSDAIGGVVTYLTKDPSDFLDGKEHPYYAGFIQGYDSSNNELSETITTALRAGPVDLLLVYTRRDGEETSNLGDYGPNPLSYNSNNVLGKAVWTINPDHKLTLTSEMYNFDSNSQISNQLGSFLVTSFGPQQNRTSIQQGEDTNRFRVSLRHDFKTHDDVPIFDEGSWQAYYQQSTNNEQIYDKYTRQSTFPAPGAVVPYTRFFERDYTNDVVGGNVQFTKFLECDNVLQRLTYGADVSNTLIERNVNGFIRNEQTGVESLAFGTAPSASGPYFMPYKEVPDTSVLRFGAYVQDEITVGDDKEVIITPGLRADYYDLSVKQNAEYTKIVNRSGVEFSEWSLSPKLGIVGKITPEVTGYGQYSQGFRAPTTEDLNGVFNNPTSFYKVLPNEKLESETSYNTEIGFRGNHAFMKWDVAGYYNYYQNFINQQTLVGIEPGTGMSLYQSVNIDEAHIFGTTLRTEFPLGYWNEHLDGLSVILGAAFTWGEDLQNHKPLDSVDPYKFMSTLRYRKKDWGVDLVGTYVAEKQAIAAEPGFVNFQPPGYHTLDLVAYYEPTPYTKLSIGVYNMTDQKYWLWQDVRNVDARGNMPMGAPASAQSQIDRFTQPGISVRTSVGIQF